MKSIDKEWSGRREKAAERNELCECVEEKSAQWKWKEKSNDNNESAMTMSTILMMMMMMTMTNGEIHQNWSCLKSGRLCFILYSVWVLNHNFQNGLDGNSTYSEREKETERKSDRTVLWANVIYCIKFPKNSCTKQSFRRFLSCFNNEQANNNEKKHIHNTKNRM